MRHSCAHLMAYAVQLLYPKTQFGIGPDIEDGFYYDFDIPDSLSEDNLIQIEQTMREIQERNLPFEKKTVPINEALKIAKELGQVYKIELIKKLKKEGEKTVGFYHLGDFIDLCAGPHVRNTSQIGPFKLLSVAGAYWRGDEKNKMLTRIYGTCFPTKSALEKYLIHYQEAKKRDHRLIGKDQKIFMFDGEVGRGLPIYLPNGAMIRHLLTEFALNTYLKRGYQLVWTPHIGSEKLWQRSGHLEFYAEGMYGPVEIEGKKYRLKPMNCPFHVKIYNSELRSYRDLPLRLTEMGTVYRYEKTGEMHGLVRPRGFTQDDAHIICTQEQLEDEIKAALDLTTYIYRTLKMEELIFKVSVRDPKNLGKYFGKNKDWERAEKTLKKALTDAGHKDYEIDVGGAVFYAPKIDIDAVDSMGRRWQLSTIQVDFNLPSRFKMTYIGKDGKKKIPFMIHRALLGSIERFLGVYIEHVGGAFPVWLSPVQVVIIPITEKHLSYAQEVAESLKKEGLRFELDDSDQTTSAKIRQAEIKKIPYMLAVGDKEIKAKTVNVRARGEKNLGPMKIDKFLKLVKEDIAKKRRV